MIDKTKDFNGNKLPHFWDSERLTVGDLKKVLEEYEDTTRIYIEASNAYNKNDTMWSQKALRTYSCIEYDTKKKGLMIVGSIR